MIPCHYSTNYTVSFKNKQHKGSEARIKVRCRCPNNMHDKREGVAVLLAAVMRMTTIRMMHGGTCQTDKRHWEWNCCRRRGFANEDTLLITNPLLYFFFLTFSSPHPLIIIILSLFLKQQGGKEEKSETNRHGKSGTERRR